MTSWNVRFELVVWHEPAPIPRERAARVREELAAGADRAPHPGVGTFAAELSALFPGLEPLVRPGHAVVTMQPQDADQISAAVFPLARKHGLVCYDPVRGLVHNLEPVGVYPGMQLHTGDGLIITDPDLGLVHDALGTLSMPHNPFAVLVCFGRHFLQVSPAGEGFELEYKDGAAGVIHRTLVRDLGELRRCFAEYAAGSRDFLGRHSWRSQPVGRS